MLIGLVLIPIRTVIDLGLRSALRLRAGRTRRKRAMIDLVHRRIVTGFDDEGRSAAHSLPPA